MTRAPTNQDTRLLRTLERLLEIPVHDVKAALNQAMDLVAEALQADKVDAFLYESTRDTLIAIGTSNQPLSALQKKHGLDALQISNGGRVVQVFKTGETFVSGHIDRDPDELPGVKDVLQIKSKIGVPLRISTHVRGVMMVASQKPDYWGADDVRFTEAVGRWVSAVAHKAELVQELARNAAEQGRRAVADELITVLAHDLRNYISPIAMRINMVRRRCERDARKDDSRDLELALKAVNRLSGLIAEVLDVARIDQGVFQMEVQQVDLVELVTEVSSALGTPEQPVRIRCVEDVVVSADPLRLRQCIENLLSNGLKHSPKETEVIVQVSRERRDATDWARVDVIDQGPGVPHEILPRIFERFVTGQKSGGGLGLGLYLAKRIAAMHGGDLSVHSRPGEGARFSLTLPCHPGH